MYQPNSISHTIPPLETCRALWRARPSYHLWFSWWQARWLEVYSRWAAGWPGPGCAWKTQTQVNKQIQTHKHRYRTRPLSERDMFHTQRGQKRWIRNYVEYRVNFYMISVSWDFGYFVECWQSPNKVKCNHDTMSQLNECYLTLN